MAKKQMTTYEKVQLCLKGASNEEAEDVAVKILAQIFAKHMYVYKDADAWLDKILSNLTQSTLEYAHNNAMILAIGSAIHDMSKDKKIKSNYGREREKGHL